MRLVLRGCTGGQSVLWGRSGQLMECWRRQCLAQ